MEHPHPLRRLNAHPESSDDASSDTHNKKKSTSKPSRKFEVSHAQLRKEEVAGKALFSVLNDYKPKVFEVQKTDNTITSPVEKLIIESPSNLEKQTDKTEATAGLDIILPDEKQTLARNILTAEAAALHQEMQETVPGSEEAAEAANAASYIDEVSRRLESGALASEELFDDALDDILHDLGLDGVADENAHETSKDEMTIGNSVAEIANDSQEDDEETAVGSGSGTLNPSGGAVGAGGYSGNSSPTGGGSGRGGASAGTPPSPPPPPGGARGGGSGLTPPPGGGAVPFSPATPAGRSFGLMGGGLRPPATVLVEAPTLRNRRRDLLVGGLVGYLIGRRRGRIKTEKKLLPVQKSLERQVKDLSNQIINRELMIRKLTAENLQKDKTAQLTSQKQLKQQSVDSQNEKLLVDVSQSVKTAQNTELKVSVEAKTRQVDKLTAMIMPVPEKIQEVREYSGAVSREQQWSQQELLETAAKIRFGDTSLKKLIEQGIIRPQEAEQAVELYLNGDSQYEKIIQNEISSPAQTEKFETLRKKKTENFPDTPVVQQTFLAPREGDAPAYSPVAAMNSQLPKMLEKSTIQKSKNRSGQLVLWSVLVVVALSIVGLVLFSAV